MLAALTEVSIATDNRVIDACWAEEEAARTGVAETLTNSGFQVLGQEADSSETEFRAFLTIGAFGHMIEDGSCIVVLELAAEHLLTYRVPGSPDRLASSNLLVWRDSSVLSGPASGLPNVILIEAMGLAQRFVLAAEEARRQVPAGRRG